MIAESCNLSPVTGIGLVYYEPQTELTEANIDDALLDDGFNIPFSAHLLPLELNPERIILLLLKEVRKLADMKNPPDGIDGCEDCQKLKEIVQLAKD